MTLPDPSPTAHEPTPRPVVLRTLGLTKKFGRTTALDNLEIEVREGEIYGFLGRNGAGKTTTLRSLMGILRPDRGEIELLGRPVRRVDVKTKQRIGYVSQEPHCYPWMSCRALGRFVGGFYPTWDAAEFDRLLRVLDLPPDRRFSQLSGGMQMKLSLALAVAHRPALLILDEPTAGLDPVARREFLDLIASQARNHGRTTLFSTHLIDEVDRVADRVGIIDEGRMRYQGSTAALKHTVRRVRPVATPAGGPPPLPLARPGPEFEVLREEGGSSILRAAPEAWLLADFGAPAVIEPLSLEDIFLAYAIKRVAEI